MDFDGSAKALRVQVRTSWEDSSLRGEGWVAGGPEALTVRVSDDRGFEDAITRTPEYERLVPNGETCGPVCEMAVESWEIDLVARGDDL